MQSADDYDNYEDRALINDPELSFALSFLRNGAIGYYGHMCMWGSTDWPMFLTNCLLKDINESTGDLLVNWYNIPNEASIITDTVGHVPNDTYGMDWNRWQFSAVILYGDPAVRFNILKTSTFTSFTTNEIIIFPNPANDLLNITNLNLGSTINIFSISGQKIKEIKAESKVFQINISDFEYGLYIIKITNKTESYILKMIKD